jgi:hypothetical protein
MRHKIPNFCGFWNIRVCLGTQSMPCTLVCGAATVYHITEVFNLYIIVPACQFVQSLVWSWRTSRTSAKFMGRCRHYPVVWTCQVRTPISKAVHTWQWRVLPACFLVLLESHICLSHTYGWKVVFCILFLVFGSCLLLINPFFFFFHFPSFDFQEDGRFKKP